MKILQLVHNRQRRGAEVFAFDLSRALRSRGVECPTAYLYETPGDNPLPLIDGDINLTAAQDNPLERIPGIQPLLLRRLLRQIDRFRPDVVQANGSNTVKYGSGCRALRPSKWKLVYRNIGFPSHWPGARGHRNFAYRKAIMPQVDGVAAVSAACLEDARRLYELKAPCRVIWCGVDPEALRPTTSRAELRGRLRVDEGTVVVLFLGSLTRIKRPDRFVRLVRRLRQLNLPAQGWVVGDGPIRPAVEAEAKDLIARDDIQFLGSQQRVGDFLAAADVLVVTSDSEGLPAVVLEAALFEVPAVASHVGGVGEFIQDGQNGRLVPAADEVNLAKVVSELVRTPDLRERLGREAARNVRHSFTIDRSATDFIRFYQDLLRIPQPS